jgi:hypothetical protein
VNECKISEDELSEFKAVLYWAIAEGYSPNELTKRLARRLLPKEDIIELNESCAISRGNNSE